MRAAKLARRRVMSRTSRISFSWSSCTSRSESGSVFNRAMPCSIAGPFRPAELERFRFEHVPKARARAFDAAGEDRLLAHERLDQQMRIGQKPADASELT